MLILTRRIGEALVIGRSITVTPIDSRGNQVRLAIVAPREIPVDREEVRARKIAEARSAHDPDVPKSREAMAILLAATADEESGLLAEILREAASMLMNAEQKEAFDAQQE